MTDEVEKPRPFQRMVGFLQRNSVPILFFGLNALGSAFWTKYGLSLKDSAMKDLFVASAAASVVSSGMLTLIKSDLGSPQFDAVKKALRTFVAGPLHNVTGVPTVIAGFASHPKKDWWLVGLGACTIGGSLFAVWGEPLLRATRADRLMKALKIDQIPVLKDIPLFGNPDASTVAFIFYLGVIPTVFKDALQFGAPYLAAAGACYTASILSLPFRGRKKLEAAQP